MLKVTVTGNRGEGKSCLVTMIAAFLQAAGHRVNVRKDTGEFDLGNNRVVPLNHRADIEVIDTTSPDPDAKRRQNRRKAADAFEGGY